jgi:fatty-acyl-CoA synthase
MNWTSHTLSESLAAAAAEVPDREALVIAGERITYGALWQRVRLAAANLKRLGLRKGEHVAICLPNSIDWVVVWYATATLGAVAVPVNTRFKTDEIKYCLTQSDSRMLITADQFLRIDFIAMLRDIEPAIDRVLPGSNLPLLRSMTVFGTNVPTGALAAETLSEPADALPDAASEAAAPDDVMLIQYTSGTTSFPKGVMLTHDSMLRDAASVGQRLGLRPDDRYFYVRPFYHVAGTTLALLCCLEARITLVGMQVFEPGEALRLLEEERCTVTGGNDTIFFMLMTHPDFPTRKLRVRVGWAAASPSVMQDINDRFGMTGLCSAFGQSESSPNVWMAHHDDRLDKRIAGFGHPLPGLEVRIADPETGVTMPPGTPGEILIRGWSVMKGYYKMPEQTARAIDRDGWLHTGDLGVMDEDGRAAFAGRLKDVFRVGGENVAPAELEDVLHRHPGVRQAQVIGVPDRRLGEVPAAYVILKPDAVVTPSELIAWCSERCANFRVPRYVRTVDNFEAIGMTGSAKVQKNKLRAYAIDDLGLTSTTAGAASG